MTPVVGEGTRMQAADALVTLLMPCTQPHWPGSLVNDTPATPGTLRSEAPADSHCRTFLQ